MAITPKSSTSTLFSIQGKIIRKKKVIPNLLRLNIQAPNDEHTTPIFIPNETCEAISNTYGFNIFYLDSTICIKGYFAHDSVNDTDIRIAEECTLLTCAPNIKMMKDVLSLADSTLHAPIFNMTPQELSLLLQNKSQKTILHEILSRLRGGGIAKAPPRKRNARLRYPDMQILTNKEVEGMNCQSWKLCQPCKPLSIEYDPKKQSVSNLPEGASDSISHHHKLTRSEYLENKKNNQTTWFVERIRQFANRPKYYLDVGGGRGDLSVALALSFPGAKVLTVDCNDKSIEAGKVYAEQCGVCERIEFVKMDFVEYVKKHMCQSRRDEIDCVVALHACGDLSDMALSFARSISCNFVICPCCYPKRYLAPFVPHWHTYCKEEEVDSLTRLVELDDRPEVSRRAMVVINSMRKDAFGDGVVLEEFDDKISKRNQILVNEILKKS